MLIALLSLLTLDANAETTVYWFLGDGKGAKLAGPVTSDPAQLCNAYKTRTEVSACNQLVQAVQTKLREGGAEKAQSAGVVYRKGNMRIGVTPDKRGDILIGGEPIDIE